ncbi:RNA-directed DNA polymerase [Senna tora]|uniref:RNA-directed DNA polymerase n=1 Tax=Senna tora TaxID=362788 RepID=A0A834X1G9_9FABA|nr:RNA-directed DNA polymerase [Senna tora]
MSLLDFGFVGFGFTWKQIIVTIMLDRVLANASWCQAFPEASVLHLPNPKSNHNLLWLRFSIVESVSSKGDPWKNALQEFYEKVEIWNKDVFGNIFIRK